MRWTTSLSIRRRSMLRTVNSSSSVAAPITRLGDGAGQIQVVAGHGRVLAVLDLDLDGLGELVDRGAPIGNPRVVADLDHDRHAWVIFVRQLTDELADEILDRDETVDAAVFVHDNGDARLAGPAGPGARA